VFPEFHYEPDSHRVPQAGRKLFLLRGLLDLGERPAWLSMREGRIQVHPRRALLPLHPPMVAQRLQRSDLCGSHVLSRRLADGGRDRRHLFRHPLGDLLGHVLLFQRELIDDLVEFRLIQLILSGVLCHLLHEIIRGLAGTV
jgi:hypothetical protein